MELRSQDARTRALVGVEGVGGVSAMPSGRRAVQAVKRRLGLRCGLLGNLRSLPVLRRAARGGRKSKVEALQS